MRGRCGEEKMGSCYEARRGRCGENQRGNERYQNYTMISRSGMIYRNYSWASKDDPVQGENSRDV